MLDARLAIKHKDFAAARKMLGGRLEPYLKDESQAKALSYALKIIINIVYGLTSASFDNPFRDVRNKDNIVAKRGALFMIDLKEFVESKGFKVVHVKTDSIKVPDLTDEMFNEIQEFGKKYGYTFENETTYERFCLVNDAVYVGYDEDGWETVGAQFQVPYVKKRLLTKEDITFDDLCVTKTVQTAMYLDFNEGLPEDEHNYKFVGKVGRFTPVESGWNGGVLLRSKDDKYHAVTGTKGYRWMEAEVAQSIEDIELDHTYFDAMVEEAIKTLDKFGDAKAFLTLERS